MSILDGEFEVLPEDLEGWSERCLKLAKRLELEGDADGAKMFYMAAALFAEERQRYDEPPPAPKKDYVS